MAVLKPLLIPNGQTEIAAVFGGINSYIKISPDNKMTLDPAFEYRYIVNAGLPYPIRLAWAPERKTTTICCHKLLADRFAAAFELIGKDDRLARTLFYGGCYNFRMKRNGTGLSTHAWGIAIDINPEANLPGTDGDMAPEIVAVFKGLGFVWGGDWLGASRDSMHFQYCSGF